MGKKARNANSEVPGAQPNFLSSFEDVKSEFRKISWTEGSQLIVYTKIVVMTTLIFGLVIYGIDLLIKGSLEGIYTLLRFFAG